MTSAAGKDAARPSWLAGLAAAGVAVPAALATALPGLVYAAGFDHLAYGLGLLAGVVLAGLLIAPHLAAARSPTPVSALGERFGPLAAGLAALITVLVAAPLLGAELSLVGVVAEQVAGLGYLAALGIAAALVLGGALALGETALMAISVLAWLLLAAGLLLPLGLLAAKSQGLSVPLLPYGAALKEITGLEEQLVEGRLVDFETFSAHLTPFARLTELDLFALIVTLALGTAALPHLAAAMTRAHGAARLPSTRLAGAWTTLFVMIVLAAVPALAAFAKLEIYREIAAATPLAKLPAWLELPLGSDYATVGGISVRLLQQVADAVRAGNGDFAAISAGLAAKSALAAERWQALDPGAQAAMVETAGKLAADASASTLWDAYRTMLPTVAGGAESQSPTLTQAAIAMQPLGLFLAIPGLTGFPGPVAALMLAAATLSALVIAARLVRAVTRLVPARAASLRPLLEGGFALAVVAAAVTIAAGRPADLVALVVTALAIAGSGLFPALAVGLAWRRATRAGVVAAMLLGTAMTLYYVAGTKLYPTAFYATWPWLSNAGETAVEEWNAVELDQTDAEDDEAKAAALAARDDLARGTATRAGLANWAGVDGASAAVFGAPLGLAALVLVSLLTRRRDNKQASSG